MFFVVVARFYSVVCIAGLNQSNVPERMTSCTHICRSILFEKLSSNADPGTPIPEELLVHRDYVFSLLKSTVQSGENNSALIIGPRGSGKTKVIIVSIKYFIIIYKYK
jgi:Cdc6-like AAA superfamily ATPase